MKILVTGAAGFIGSALSIRLLDRGDEVIGIDNLNDYYDPKLKEARMARHLDHPNFTHVNINLEDREGIKQLFEKEKPQGVVNLAAQAGVRYSIENPLAYVDTNLVGFAHILEGCRHNNVEHFVYASSSSVYGSNTNMPFSIHDNVDHPLSLYAATKKANELMAHTYSNLYNLPTTGLRFFTVYGPWGRPDMALFKFTKAMLEGESIPVFNYGKHRRDFTYIDDLVTGIVLLISANPDRDIDTNQLISRNDSKSPVAPFRVVNIGNSTSEKLTDYISALEDALGLTAKKNFMPMQQGDVEATWADSQLLETLTGYRPATDISTGVKRFVDWYRNFYRC